MIKFDWMASESAPRFYPMQIVSGTLFYHGEPGGLYVPDRTTIDGGWGRGISAHVVGPKLKPLPERLGISFFSYTENQFYDGNFSLPYEKILSMFQAGFYSHNQGEHSTYDQIVVGVAPGGAVAVWVAGIDRKVEVFFGYADKVDTDWGALTSATHVTREEYVRIMIEDSLKTPEAREALRRDGVPFGRWERYHKARYAWQPLFTNMPLLDGRISDIRYYNGEEDYIDYPVKKEDASATRAVPSEISFIWARPTAKPLLVELYFDETEIFETFEKVGKRNLPMQLEMRIAVKNGKNDFTVWLRNEKEALELKKIKVDTYGIPERATQ